MKSNYPKKTTLEQVIADKGVVIIGPRQKDYSGLTTGIPQGITRTKEPSPEPKATS